MDIGNRDVVLQFSWLTENKFSVNTQKSCLKNVYTKEVMSYSIM